jgi:hypothetical protein
VAKSFAVKARLEATDAASKVISAVQGRFKQFAGFLASKFTITLGDVERMVGRMADALTSNIKAAQEQEDAIRSLEAALGDLGPQTAEVSKQLQDQAAAIQSVSRYGDEAVIAAQAYLKTLGVQADQLPLATQATVDLAAALKIDLTSAARNVGKTVGGFAGELGEVIPELKDLDVAALRAGDGIKLLADKFAGRAQEDAKTYSGLIDQISNAFGDLQEKIGEAVTKNEKINAQLERLRDLLTSDQVVAQVEAMAKHVADLSVNLVSSAAELGNFVAGVQNLSAALGSAWENAKRLSPDIAAQAEILGFATGGYQKLASAVTAWGAESVKQNTIQAETDRLLGLIAEKQLAARLGALGMAEAYRQTADAADTLAGSTSNAASSTERLNVEQRTAIDGLRALGIVLEGDVNEKIEKNNKLLEDATLLYQTRARVNGELVVSELDLARAEAIVTAENEKLKASLDGTGEAAITAGSGLAVASGGLRSYAAEAVQATTAVARLNTTLAESADAAADGGGSFAPGAYSPASLAGVTMSNGVARDMLGRRFYGSTAGGMPVAGPGGQPTEAGERFLERVRRARRSSGWAQSQIRTQGIQGII